MVATVKVGQIMREGLNPAGLDMPRLPCFSVLMEHSVSSLMKEHGGKKKKRRTWEYRQVKSLTVVTQPVSCGWGSHCRDV